MVVRDLWYKLLLVLACTLPTVVGATLTADFDRDSIGINETARLVIESDAGRSQTPDLSVLEKHFNILGQSTRQNISVVNGQRSTVIQYIIDLAPRQEGSFTIDPIQIGNESTPIMRITVLPERVANGQSSDIFIEPEVDHDTVYVQQQLQLTVKLFVASQLLEGSLEDPGIPSTRIERLGPAKRYQTSRDGRDYMVYERNYALFPQKSGELEIPPIHFRGRVEQQPSNGLQFYPGQPVQARSDPVRITVKPSNPLFTGKTWLPVEELQIDEVGNISNEGKVGQPFTRQIQIQAKGITAEQLPEIRFGNLDDVRFYPDKPVRDTAVADGELVAIQQNSVAIIPAKAGTITLPPIEIDWWNTRTDKPAKTVLPARTIEIAAAPGSATPRPEPQQEIQADQSDLDSSPAQAGVESRPAPGSGNDSVWKWTALAAMALWFVTVVVTLYIWRRSRSSESADRSRGGDANSVAGWRTALKKACRNNDPATARQALAGWANADNGHPISLEAWVAGLDKADLSTALRELDQQLYASNQGPGQWSGERLWEACATIPVAANGKRESMGALHPLYPRPARD